MQDSPTRGVPVTWAMCGEINWLDVAGFAVQILIAVLIIVLLLQLRRGLDINEKLLLHIDEGVYRDRTDE